jgi:hypothetical protein
MNPKAILLGYCYRLPIARGSWVKLTSFISLKIANKQRQNKRKNQQNFIITLSQFRPTSAIEAVNT